MLLNPGITAHHLLKQQAQRAAARRDAEAREQSRDDDVSAAHVRVRAYAFGDHLRRAAGAGALVVVPNAVSTDMNIVKGVLLRAVYGDDVAFDRVDWTTVSVFLLPDGEEIRSAGERRGRRGKGTWRRRGRRVHCPQRTPSHTPISTHTRPRLPPPPPPSPTATAADLLCANDKLVVYIGASAFSGDIHDKAVVEAHLRDAGFGPPRGDIDGVDGGGGGSPGGGGGGGGDGGGYDDDYAHAASSRTSMDFQPDAAESRQFTSATANAGGGGGGGRHSRWPPSPPNGQQRQQAAAGGSPDAGVDADAGGVYTGLASESFDAGGGGGGDADGAGGDGAIIDPQLYRPAHERGRRYSAPDALELGVARSMDAARESRRHDGASDLPPRGGGGGGSGARSASVGYRRAGAGGYVVDESAVVDGIVGGSGTPESLIASKAEALLARLEQLEQRTRGMDASAAGGLQGAPGGAGGGGAAGGGRVPALGGAKLDANGRRLSLVANQKLRRAVHKLVLINRFNKSALVSGPAATAVGSRMSVRSGGSGGSGVSGFRAGASAAASKRSRWGFSGSRSKSIGKVMDQYIKEQSNLYEYTEVRKHTVKDDERLPWYLIRPDAGWRVAWDMVMLVLVVYYSLMVPVRIGFDLVTCECARARLGPAGRWVGGARATAAARGMTQSAQAPTPPPARPPTRSSSPPSSPSLLPAAPGEHDFDYFADVFFILDIALSFMTTYKEDGLYVASRAKVARGYARTWFPMDVLASFPIGWFTEQLASSSTGASSINKMLRMLRLFKLFRLLRLLKLFPRLLMVLETTIRVDPALLRFLRSFLMLLLMWHVMGSAYWFMVRLEYNGTAPCPAVPGRPDRVCFVNHCLCDVDLTRDETRVTVLPETDEGWYDPFMPDIWVPHASLANEPLMRQYWRAIFWAVEATTSIGDNIVPRSTQETIFSTVMILFGLMMYSMIIGSASSALANLDAEAAEQKQALERIIGYMRQRNVPKFFQKIIKGE
jgi:hypothetical protein